MEWKHPSYYKELYKKKKKEDEQSRSRSTDESQRTDDTQEDTGAENPDA
jgi:hypothetical protein